MTISNSSAISRQSSLKKVLRALRRPADWPRLRQALDEATARTPAKQNGRGSDCRRELAARGIWWEIEKPWKAETEESCHRRNRGRRRSRHSTAAAWQTISTKTPPNRRKKSRRNNLSKRFAMLEPVTKPRETPARTEEKFCTPETHDGRRPRTCRGVRDLSPI